MAPRFIVTPDGKIQIVEDEAAGAPTPTDPIRSAFLTRAPDLGVAAPPAPEQPPGVQGPELAGLERIFGPGSPGRMSRLAAAAEEPEATPEDKLATLQGLRGEPGPDALPGVPGGLPDVREPGDVARLRAEKKIAQLTAFRDISEGLGRAIPVEGDIRRGRQLQGFRAEGIREAIGREGAKLGDLAAEDKLRLQSQLRREETQEEFGLRALDQALKGTPLKPLTAQTMNRLTAMDHLERELGKVLKEKGKYNTGPVVNAFETGLSWIIGEWAYLPSGGEKAGFKATLNNVLAQYVRAVEGGRPSDADRRFLSTVTPRPGDDDSILVDKTERLIEWTKENRAQLRIYLQNSGYALPEEVKIVQVEIDGEPGEIPANELGPFKDKYPNATIYD